MKEIVVISGKGGTGKTSFTVALASVADRGTVLADCDVDAADLHLLLQPVHRQITDFYSSELAVVNSESCSLCGQCEAVCRFDAIHLIDGEVHVDPIACEGCGYCALICPEQVIQMERQKDGVIFYSDTRLDKALIHAELRPGAENSGKLVALVKKEAKRYGMESGADFVLADGSPGIGCPVISSLSGADVVLFVTESTTSGFHDLKRVVELSRRFRARAGGIINKADLHPELTREIRDYFLEQKIVLLAEFNFTEDVPMAMKAGLTLAEYHNRYWEQFVTIWNAIKQLSRSE